MDTVAEGLAITLRSLSKADKLKVISLLWKDAETREVMVELLIRRLSALRENHSARDYSSLVQRIEIGLTPKERAKRLRESYISKLQKQGLPVRQINNVWATTPLGLWIAVPVATERRPHRWFLGLPEKEVLERINKGGVVVVLLCEQGSGSILDIVIPSHKVIEIVGSLSKSGGQLKFNLRKVGSRYQLVMPGTNPLDVSDYLGDVSSF